MRVDVNSTTTVATPQAAIPTAWLSADRAEPLLLRCFPALHWLFVFDQSGVMLEKEDDFFDRRHERR